MIVLPTSMEVVLKVYLFSLFVTSGASLQCETCTEVGKSCSGREMTCPAGHDSCAIGLTETSIAGVIVSVTVKGCTSSSTCRTGAAYANLGKGKVRGKVFCCTGLTCALLSPQLPPINNTYNGKQCPGCYSFASSCVPEVAYCTGSENYCFDAVIQEYGGALETYLKGCASEVICHGLQTGVATLGRVSRGHCRPASRAPPTSGSIALALSGLLMMKFRF